ncbi:MAG: hypothetical protein L0H53_15460 [Candidatus Nitrosocosmicus sp.]|nr:hypothetical protein [Candidatus Nitrosocosmicus sp.]
MIRVKLTEAQNPTDSENQIIIFLLRKESDSFGEFKIHSGEYDINGRLFTALIVYIGK